MGGRCICLFRRGLLGGALAARRACASGRGREGEIPPRSIMPVEQDATAERTFDSGERLMIIKASPPPLSPLFSRRNLCGRPGNVRSNRWRAGCQRAFVAANENSIKVPVNLLCGTLLRLQSERLLPPTLREQPDLKRPDSQLRGEQMNILFRKKSPKFL
ncbi:unnamed protein product [Pleuronectes platessa]|uniref:Uncharacterized protein n=1 Tax=Pleuronectes platessa TaxID=8262 RepID=A0A9N7VD21_PLEPL|nr:unnamed protein product [Pleuronectes platessa]